MLLLHRVRLLQSCKCQLAYLLILRQSGQQLLHALTAQRGRAYAATHGSTEGG